MSFLRQFIDTFMDMMMIMMMMTTVIIMMNTGGKMMVGKEKTGFRACWEGLRSAVYSHVKMK